MVKLTRESKRILYLAASIVSLLFMLFFAWTLIQYFFAPASSTSAQEAPTAQGQTVAGASGTQTDSQTAQTQGSSSSDAQSNADASKTQDSSNQKTSEPSNSGNSTNAVAAPRKENGALSVSVTVDGSAAKGSSFTVNLQVQEGTSVYDALLASGAGVNARSTSFGMYVAAINGLAERDHGPQSGWVYSVNGVQPNYTSDAYVLHDGDSVVWMYVNAVN